MLSKFRQLTLGLAAVAAISLPTSAATTILPLGNLFDDNGAATIDAAIASDTYGAQADPTDLGVVALFDSAHQSPMNVAITIAPGLSFNYTSVGGGTAFSRPIRNDAWGDIAPIRTLGNTTGYNAGAGKIEDGFGMHANGLVTFDLNALRAAGLSEAAALLTAHFDQNDDQAANGSYRGSIVVSDAYGNVLAGYVNGQKQAVVKTAGTWSFTGTIPANHTGAAASGLDFNVGLPTTAAYVTFAATSTSITSAHAVWSAPQINTAPVIQLGNLFDDANTATLWNALATDTYKASAGTDDLGVDTVQAGNLNVAQSLNSGGVMFNFTSAGGGVNSSDGLVNDAIGGGVGSRGPLRLDGPAGYPTSASWEIKIEDGIGIHANRFVTFDLDEIRTAGGLGNSAFRFTSIAGLNDSSTIGNGIHALVLLSDDSGVIAGYIDGQLVNVTFSAGEWSFTGTVPALIGPGSSVRSNLFDIIISRDVRYLTLAGTGGSDITADHVAFVDANLTTFVPTPAALPAGLMLLAFATLKRRR